MRSIYGKSSAIIGQSDDFGNQKMAKKKKEKMVELKVKQPKKQWVEGLAKVIGEYMINNNNNSSPIPKMVVTIGKKKSIVIKSKATQPDIMNDAKIVDAKRKKK